MSALIPNVFLIGVQKSATTSIYDWMAQHPDVCGPVSLKDTPFFIDDRLYYKGLEFLQGIYRRDYKGQQVILNGSAHNIYFEKALKRISELNPDAKLILILRDPAERAFSAYNFAVKRNLEKQDFASAIADEGNRIHDPDLKIRSETTYVDHGLYFKQIQRLFTYFKPEQLKVILYEDVREKADKTIEELYEFIGVKTDFTPDFRKLNKTGSVKYAWIKNMVYNDSKWKRFLLRHVIDPLIPYDLKYRAKIFLLNAMTGKSKKNTGVRTGLTPENRKMLNSLFREDIRNLEKLLGRDLSAWKA